MRAREIPAQEDWKALVQRWIMGWKGILIKVVLTDGYREQRTKPKGSWGKKVQGMGMGMLDLILKMSSEWQEEWGCAQQCIARLGFTATGDCRDAELRRSEKNAWAL